MSYKSYSTNSSGRYEDLLPYQSNTVVVFDHPIPPTAIAVVSVQNKTDPKALTFHTNLESEPQTVKSWNDTAELKFIGSQKAAGFKYKTTHPQANKSDTIEGSINALGGKVYCVASGAKVKMKMKVGETTTMKEKFFGKRS